MEEILAFFGFSLGASLGIGAVRTLADGSQPIVREVFKAGIRAWDTVTSTSASMRDAVTAEQPVAETRRGGRRRTQPEKIAIARQ
jgi:hypothetical protein